MNKKQQIMSLSILYYGLHNIEGHLADFLLDFTEEGINFDDVDGLLSLREAYNEISAVKGQILSGLTGDITDEDWKRFYNKLTAAGQQLADALRSLREKHHITSQPRLAHKVQAMNDIFNHSKMKEWFPYAYARSDDVAPPHICLTDDSAPYVAM